MKISIFTPTHNPKYLKDCYKSLINQTYKDWEWVILVNGSANNLIIVNDIIQDDNRVIVEYDSSIEFNIGSLKRECVSYCTGEYVLELDHDDMLAPNALFDIVSTISIDNPDFIYSDFCEFRGDGSSNIYDSIYGWESYPFDSDILPDKSPYIAMKAPEILPRNLYQIYYAPNHVRVWKKSFYEQISGHSDMSEYRSVFENNKYNILAQKNKNRESNGLESLETINFAGVCDDHDLICRTYLMGGKMVHIPKPLYFYRLQNESSNSYLQFNEEIQFLQQQVGNRYFYDLVEKWADDNKLELLDFGGAHNPKKGYKSVDILDGVDIQCDVTKGIPLPDNSVGCIRAYDFFEHISREGYELEPYDPKVYVHIGYNLIKKNPWVDLWNEMYRVLAPGGWILSATPIGNTPSYMGDPTHVNQIDDTFFEYVCNKDKNKYVDGLNVRFQGTRIFKSDDYVFADLQCLKDNKTMGIVKI